MSRLTVDAIVLTVLLLFGAYAVAGTEKVEWPNEQGGMNSLTLLDTPCKASVSVHIKDQYVPLFRAALLTYDGHNYDSCWIKDDNYVHSIDETGDLMRPIPRAAFVKDGTV